MWSSSLAASPAFYHHELPPSFPLRVLSPDWCPKSLRVERPQRHLDAECVGSMGCFWFCGRTDNRGCNFPAVSPRQGIWWHVLRKEVLKPCPELTVSLLRGDRPAHPFRLPEPLGFAMNQSTHPEARPPSSIPLWLTHKWTACGWPPISLHPSLPRLASVFVVSVFPSSQATAILGHSAMPACKRSSQLRLFTVDNPPWRGGSNSS